MSNLYAISDLHYSHKNMALWRGFETVEAHDKHIINSWNSVIKKRDIVWILGDITMEKADYAFLDLLNGRKKVVLGNHDKPQHVRKLLNYVDGVCGAFQYKGGIFTHVPIIEQELLRFRFNMHGHTHKDVMENPKYINVCCEQTDYTPRLINDLIA